ncbi:non-heme iron oxygenase ferredoxin subunit [Mesorhizobium sp. M1D.F.Ca.ET.184.01.1.1]|nr:non-heme iron oxygenase ferredoxin subunit [Mesorhizobium sp. M1D.F.Ca.ET.231.01.1.1]TGP33555.1 non-heme iron oxygenase ferredoxin subunit [Mesorhizobium sp. M1D.F.Ca.ET.234.01.1.1]TGS46922.1 non-heme iron oxygenase ferredoxin subunit [Mesorhizobium sp. M1D.F.Ca.ET.184.01.1.1]TGS62181.1 non-heme iron oxygenase ferredoxin subunit [Mesorhizobium sp. M1D.F.Ca.ET.183.01.1.1]
MHRHLQSRRQIYATAGVCTHAHAFLSEGYIDGQTIECPLHQGLFHIPTGTPLSPPVTERLKTYETKVADGYVHILVQGGDYSRAALEKVVTGFSNKAMRKQEAYSGARDLVFTRTAVGAGSDHEKIVGEQRRPVRQRRELCHATCCNSVGIVGQLTRNLVIDDVVVGVVGAGSSEEVLWVEGSGGSKRLHYRILEHECIGRMVEIRDNVAVGH